MKGYWIAFVDVTHPEQYQDYLKLAPAALKAYGARILARSDQLTALEGFTQPPSRAVVLEFDSYEQALACYNSPEYQQACHHRQDAANAQIVIMKGSD
ncbi:DUF1330 domain-containing protein [Marinobacterium jannaschii]|uniref:DUF1330 domain-containing protein n=1 Tax=Marinobacterium jannaschii TaxID=64970 RepID=UPI0004880F23|nr:DUF1330 domain-containing protein [Marinobacterium jannaschii]